MQGFSGRLGTSIAGSGPTDIFINGTKQTAGAINVDFTGIPSGVKEFKVSFQNLSPGGTDRMLFQLGDSGGFTTTGYNSSVADITGTETVAQPTNGLPINNSSGTTATFNGIAHFVLIDAATNLWSFSCNSGRSDSTEHSVGAGSVALSSELTQVRLTTSAGSNAYDGGTVNIQYDNPDPTVIANVQPGKIIQQVFNIESELVSGTGTIPLDDTIPQNTEGTEFITVSITPEKANSILRIEVSTSIADSAAAQWVTMAIFKDSDADALASSTHYQLTATASYSRYLQHFMTAGSTDSITFKMRAGGAGAGTCRINSNGTSRMFGGTSSTVFTVTEIAV